METPTFTNVPSIPPQIVQLERERREAMNITYQKIEDIRREAGKVVSLVAFGREYDLRAGSAPDVLVAEAQALHTASGKVLDTVKGIDYRQEEAAAKLEAFFSSYEILITQYAELLEHHPDIAKQLAEKALGLQALANFSNTESANDKDPSNNSKEVANDLRYLAAA